MSLRTTLLLLLFALLFTGLAWWLREGQDQQPRESPLHPLVTDLPGGKAMRVELLLATGQDLAMERRGAEWWIVEPFEDRASLEAVTRLMEALKGDPVYEIGRDPSPRELASLGLEPPHARVTLYGTGGEPVRIRVGRRDATGTFTAVLYEGDPRLYRTGANLLNVLEKGRHEWRDPRFLHGDATMLRRVRISRPGEPKIVLERPGTEWMLVEPVPFGADASVVEPLIHGLLLVTVDRFEKQRPTTEDLERVGITPSTAIEVELDWGARRVRASFGPPERASPLGRRFATDSERRHLFLVRGDALARLTTPVKRMRDRRVVRVTQKNLERLVLERPGRPRLEIAYDAEERRFRMIEPFERAVDDGRDGELRRFLLAISDLEAEDFLDREELGAAPDGGDPLDALVADRVGTLHLALRERVGARSVVRIEFGRGGDAVYVRRPDRAPRTVYVVPRDEARAVLEADPRPLLDRSLFPPDLLAWKEVRVRYRGRERVLRRDPTRGAEYWRDPGDPDANTADFQSYIASLRGVDALGFLPRDPLPSDELEGPEAATVEILIRPGAGPRSRLVVVFGAVDESGETVVGTSSALPPRTLFRAEAWMRDHLVALFEGGGERR